jgi:hypothetical protein
LLSKDKIPKGVPQNDEVIQVSTCIQLYTQC